MFEKNQYIITHSGTNFVCTLMEPFINALMVTDINKLRKSILTKYIMLRNRIFLSPLLRTYLTCVQPGRHKYKMVIRIPTYKLVDHKRNKQCAMNIKLR